MRVEEKFVYLKGIIERANNEYYNLNTPKLSDAEFDAHFQRLQTLEGEFPQLVDPNSPTQRVGAKVEGFLPKIRHRSLMLSLNNAITYADMDTFQSQIKSGLKLGDNDDIEYLAQPKLDGLAVSLVYKWGELVEAATRGDGREGEDVLANIRTIRNIPLVLSDRDIKFMEVRGEVLFLKEDFKALNAQRILDGETPFVNARNAAAGTLRQLDPKVSHSRELRFFAYKLQDTSDPIYRETDYAIMDILQTLRLPTCPDTELLLNQSGLDYYFAKMLRIRDSLPYEIDGVVFKVNDLYDQARLGSTSRAPKSMIAQKFPAEKVTAVIEAIDVQVGRTGVLTPVARITPTFVGGVTVSNITLHNAAEMVRKGIHINDEVVIQRCGEVIPGVVEVILSGRKTEPFFMPDECPSCGGAVFKLPFEVAHRCLAGSNCRAQLIGQLKHFVSRKAMNIEGVGEKLLTQLLDEELIDDVSDLFKLDRENLVELPGMGEKSAANIIAAIAKSGNTTISKFIFALGIRNVGEKTAKDLADHFKNVDSIMDATSEELRKIPALGEILAISIPQYFEDPSNRYLIFQLRPFLIFEEPGADKEATLRGLTFVVTGTLPRPRSEVKSAIEFHGGVVVGSVSKNTSYLIAGENAGSKLTRAEKLGTEIIDYPAFQKLLGKKM